MKITPSTKTFFDETQTTLLSQKVATKKIQARGNSGDSRLEDVQFPWCGNGILPPRPQLVVSDDNKAITWNFAVFNKADNQAKNEECGDRALLRGSMPPANMTVASKIEDLSPQILQKIDNSTIIYTYLCVSTGEDTHGADHPSLNTNARLFTDEIINLYPDSKPYSRGSVLKVFLQVESQNLACSRGYVARVVDAYKINKILSDDLSFGFYQADVNIGAKGLATQTAAASVSTLTLLAAPSVIALPPLRLSGGSSMSHLMTIEPILNDTLLFGTFALISLGAIALMAKKLVRRDPTANLARSETSV